MGSAVSAILLALGTIYLQRQKKVVLDAEDLENELEDRTKQHQVGISHIRRLEDQIVTLGGKVPTRPSELRPGWFSRRRDQRGRRRVTADDDDE